jgi:hypothetical protein
MFHFTEYEKKAAVCERVILIGKKGNHAEAM